MKLAWVTILGASLAMASACGKAKPQAAASTCADAAKYGVEAMIAQSRARIELATLPEDVRARVVARQKKLEDAGSQMRDLLAARCRDDKWAVAVITCFTSAKSLDESRACRKQLTPAQLAALQRGELELIAGDELDAAGSAGGGDPRLVMIDSAITDARKAVTDATTDAERAAAQAQLDTLEAERKTLAAQIESLAGSAQPR